MDNIMHDLNDYKKKKADSMELQSVGKFLKFGSEQIDQQIAQQMETAIQKIRELKIKVRTAK
jgi:hypothetical protein